MSRSLPGAGPMRRCLGPELSAYADRAMCPSELRQWDRHLVACMACRQAVDAERRLLAALRGSAGPALPGDLRAMLLSVGARAEAGPADDATSRPTSTPPSGAPSGTSSRAPRRAPVRPSAAMPLRIPPPPVPVIDRTAPAMHRSAVRATVFAGLAAGASAAAAWSFAVVGTPLVPAAPAAPAPGTAVQRARPSTPSFTSASFGVPARARTALPVSATTVFFSSAGRPVVSGYRLGSAESAP